MKPFISISLLILFLGNSFLKTALILHYWQNKAEIIASCCINKNRPELDCHGKCYINSQLNQIDHNTQKELPGRLVMTDFELYILPQNDMTLLTFSQGDALTGHVDNLYQYVFAGEIFQPPTA